MYISVYILTLKSTLSDWSLLSRLTTSSLWTLVTADSVLARLTHRSSTSLGAGVETRGRRAARAAGDNAASVDSPDSAARLETPDSPETSERRD